MILSTFISQIEIFLSKTKIAKLSSKSMQSFFPKTTPFYSIYGTLHLEEKPNLKIFLPPAPRKFQFTKVLDLPPQDRRHLSS